MSKVDFTYKNGVRKVMSPRYANILQKIGRGTYATRDMVAMRPMVLSDNYDDLDAPALLEIAKDRGLKVHHKAGVEKIRAMLREAGK